MTTGVPDPERRCSAPPAGTDVSGVPVQEEQDGEHFLPDAADPEVSPEEARERIGSAGGGPYTEGCEEAQPDEG